jgi:hypothetical protein
MRSDQGELRAAVAECRWRPCNLVVTGQTVMRKQVGGMRRILGSIKICLMALPAIRVMQVVVAAGMATDAGTRQVRSDERELRAAMIEYGRRPRNLVVAGETVMRKLVGAMRNILRGVEIGLMALPAIGVVQVIIAAGMTTDAGTRQVRSDKRKLRCGVAECRRPPCALRVAGETIVREEIRCMAGILYRVEGCFMTLPAIRVFHLIVAAHVAF